MMSNKLILAGMVLGLIGCGGGGGGSVGSSGHIDTSFTGNTQAATATEDNANVLARAASEAAIYTAVSQNLPVGETSKSAAVEQQLRNELHQKITSKDQDLPIGFTQSEAGDCGGSLTISYPDSFLTEAGPGAGVHVAKTTYNNYCSYIGASTYVIDGRTDIVFTVRSNGSVSKVEYLYKFQSTQTYNGEQTVINHSNSVVCTYDTNDNELGCIVSENFTGINGKAYRVEDAQGTVSDLTARIFDEDLGYFQIDTDGLGYQCDNANFSSGSISIVDSSGLEVINVSFPNCSDCVVTYGGSAVVYSQIFQ